MAKRSPTLRSLETVDIARRLVGSRSGIAAVEFAFIAPVLVLLILAGYEAMNAVSTSTRATYLSSSLGELLSQTTNTLSMTDATRIVESAPLVDPDILSYARATGRKDIWNIATVTLSSVAFTKKVPSCTGDCEYRGDVIFSFSPNGTPLPCGEINSKAGSATLPASLLGPGSLVIVTVDVPYLPLTNLLFGHQFYFEKTSYFAPRYVDSVNYVTNCPGF